MKRSLLLLVLFAVMCGGAWLLFADRAVDFSAAIPSEETADQQVEAPALAVTGAETRDLSASKWIANGTRAFLAPPPDQTDLSRFFRVTIIDAATGEPVEAAELWFTPPTTVWSGFQGEDLRLWRASGYDMLADDVVRRFGQRRLSDAAGQVPIPIDTCPIAIACWHGNLYGRLLLDSRQAQSTPLTQDLRLMLQPDISFDVRVVDALGKPKGGVEFLFEFEIAKTRVGATQAGPRRRYVFLPGKTSAVDGVARLRHCQLDRYVAPLKLMEISMASSELVPHIAGVTGLAVPLDLRALRSEQIEIVLPRAGRLEVEVLDAAGKPALRGVRVELQVVGAPSRGWVRKSRDGLVFDPIGIGLQYQMRVRLLGRDIERVISGPASPTVAKVEVFDFSREGAGAPKVSQTTVRGRAVREGGAVLADTWLRLQFMTSRHSSQVPTPGPVRTDATGFFEVSIPSFFAMEYVEGVRLVVLDNNRLDLVDGSDERGLSLSLIKGEENDLGDFIVSKGSVLVRGRFTGAKPEAFGSVVVVVQVLKKWRTQGGDPRETWLRASAASVERPTPETFVVRARWHSRDLRLKFHAPNHAGVDPVPLYSVMSDLTVDLGESQELRVQVRVPEELEQSRLALFLKPRGSVGPDTFIPFHDKGLSRASAMGSEAGRINLAWSRLTPGEFDVLVRVLGIAKPVVIYPVTVPMTGVCEIDIRERIRHFRLEPEKRGGGSMSWARCLVETGFDGQKPEGLVMRDGVIHLFSLQASVEVMLVAGVRGKALAFSPESERNRLVGRNRSRVQIDPLEHLLISGDRKIVFAAPPDLKVLVRLAEHPELPAGFEFACKISAIDMPPLTRRQYVDERGNQILQTTVGKTGDGTWFDAGRGDFVVTLPGRYRVSVFYGTGKSFVPVAGVLPSSYEIRSSGQELVLRVPAAELAKSQARLAGLMEKAKAKKK